MPGFFPVADRPVADLPLPIIGALSVTESDDTAAATSGLEIRGSLAIAEADDVPAAAGALLITASAFVAEADDICVTTAVLEIRANVAGIEADDVPSAAGAVTITASAAITEADDTLDGLGEIEIKASLDLIEENDTLDASALMPIWHPRRGGTDEREEYQHLQREWQEDLRRIIDQSWAIAHGLIDPVTLLPIPSPDYSAVIQGLLDQALALDQARAARFMAEAAQRQEDDAIAILLLTA